MPDGSQTHLLTVARTHEPSLASALDTLLACAEQGLRPDAVLGDIRTLLSSRRLLLHGDPAPPSCGCAGAVRD